MLQADLAALRSRIDDVHANTQAGFDQLRASARVQVEQQRCETQEQLQVRSCHCCCVVGGCMSLIPVLVPVWLCVVL